MVKFSVCLNRRVFVMHLLDSIFIFIRFGTELHRQIVGTNCAPLVVDLFLFCYGRDLMMAFADDTQADTIQVFNTTSRYLYDILNIDSPYFEVMVTQMYPTELQLNKANSTDTEAPCFNLHLSISNGFVSSKMYYKRDDFNFDIVKFLCLDGDVPRAPFYGVYISQLIRFTRVSSHLADLILVTKS